MESCKKFFFKTLRLLAIFAIIYVCILFYMAISERRYAFPRAQADKTAAETLEKHAVLCRTNDGKKLQGWILNDSLSNTVLYFADTGEDAATFLENAKGISNVRIVGFNYRGSAGSEGSPGEKFYEGDVLAMIGCAGSENPIFLGHGTGGIAAYNAFVKGYGKKAILVDPYENFRDKLSGRYRIFFPEFLIRTKIGMRFDGEGTKRATIVLDNPGRRESVQKILDAHPEKFDVIDRKGASLLKILKEILEK